MAECKDCIHHDICYWIVEHGCTSKTCFYFKEKSKVIDVPCKIGDTAWCIRRYKKGKQRIQGIVDGLWISKDMKLIVNVRHVGFGVWGERIFPTKEEALAAIQEMGE